MKHDFSQLCRLEVHDQGVSMFGFRWGLLFWVIDRCHLAVFSHSGERERQNQKHRGREGELSSISSVQSLSRVWLFVTPWTAAHQASVHHTPGVYSNSCPMSWWCHPTVSSSGVLSSSHLRSFPASESFPMSQFFASGGQSIGVSASTSVLPMNTQDWFPLG